MLSEKAEHDRALQDIKSAADRELHALRERSDVLLRRLDDELQRSRYVHSLQFEKEFRLYEETWYPLATLRNDASSLRPVLDQYDPKESDKDRMRRRLKAFYEAYNAVLIVMNKHEPFFPASVYSVIDEFRRTAVHEAIGYQWGDPSKDREYWKESQTSADAIAKKVDAVCTAIRERIGLLRSEAEPQ